MFRVLIAVGILAAAGVAQAQGLFEPSPDAGRGGGTRGQPPKPATPAPATPTPAPPAVVVSAGAAATPWTRPPIEWNTIQGQRITDASFAGKVVVLHFWTDPSFSPDSSMGRSYVTAAERLRRLQQQYAARGVTFLGVYGASDAQLAQANAATWGFGWPQVADASLRTAWRATSYRWTVYVLSPKGEVLWGGSGTTTLLDTVLAAAVDGKPMPASTLPHLRLISSGTPSAPPPASPSPAPPVLTTPSRVPGVTSPPDVNWRTFAGDTITNASLRGSPVVIHFWSSGHAPSMAQMDRLVLLEHEYAAKGVRFIGVNRDASMDAGQRAVSQKGLTWPQVWNDRAETLKQWNVPLMPYAVVLSPQGQVAWSGHVALLEKALTEALPKFSGGVPAAPEPPAAAPSPGVPPNPAPVEPPSVPVPLPTVVTAEPPPPLEHRPAPPDAAALAATDRVIREAYGAEMTAATTRDAKRALGQRLFNEALQTRDDPAGRYGLMLLAARYALEAGDLSQALRATTTRCQYYKDDPLAEQCRVIREALGDGKLPVAPRDALPVLSQVVDEASRQDRHDVAEAAATMALEIARKVGDAQLVTQAGAQLDNLKSTREAYARAHKAELDLVTNPSDAPAHLEVGRYRCFVRGDYGAGLRHLAAGNDAALKALAEKELAGPADADGQMALADGWWSYADDAPDAVRPAVRRHAAEWYIKALPGLTGLSRAKAEARLRAAAVPTP